jgi:hypothetical protein
MHRMRALRRAANTRATIAGVFVALAGAAGCRCPDAFFAKDQRFAVTVLGQSSSNNTCGRGAAPRSPSFVAGDSFELVGTGDRSFEAGMCDDGTLLPNETPWFATDILTTCTPFTSTCAGKTPADCAVVASVRADRDSSVGVDQGAAPGTFSITWSSSCDLAFACEERYDVSFRPVAR